MTPASRGLAAEATGNVRLRTRWDDYDQNGHVNNAAYLALVRAAHDRAGLPAGNLRATWRYEIRRLDGILVVAGRARGAFLGLEGRARTGPRELLDDLLRGEPEDPSK